MLQRSSDIDNTKKAIAVYKLSANSLIVAVTLSMKNAS